MCWDYWEESTMPFWLPRYVNYFPWFFLVNWYFISLKSTVNKSGLFQFCCIRSKEAFVAIMTALWDPHQNFHDRRQVIPIITPFNPFINSRYHVTWTTLGVMVEEFGRTQ